MHSPYDEVIPYDQGVALYETASSDKTFVSLQGGHNDGYLRSYEVYIEALKEFLK